MRLTLIDLRK